MQTSRIRWVWIAVLVAAWEYSPYDEVDRSLKTIQAKEIQKHLATLASDSMEGREAGSAGGHQAGLYIRDHFAKYGLEPGGAEGTYFQPFSPQGASGGLNVGAMKESNYLRWEPEKKKGDGATWEYEVELKPVQGSSLAVVRGPVIFVGYGISAPEFKYDDLGQASLKGAIALVFDHEPQEKAPESPFDGDRMTSHAEWKKKVETLHRRGAVAVLLTLDPMHHSEPFPQDARLKWPSTTEGDGFPIPVAYLTQEAAQKLAALGERDLRKTQEGIDKTLKPTSFRLPGTGELSIQRTGLVGEGLKNVIGRREGSDKKLKDEYVVIGAHYDHVGRGGQGSMGGSREIHNGADDNASGTSALLEIAEALGSLKLKRSVVLIAFDGEEKGLWGSRAYVDRPTWPMDRCVAMINMDMLSRNPIAQVHCGITDKSFQPMLKVLSEAERRFQVKFGNGADDYVQRSDQWNFHLKGVPSIFLFGGMHGDYHRPSDDVERCDVRKVEYVARISCFILYRVANADRWK